jgi:hypothetical protein
MLIKQSKISRNIPKTTRVGEDAEILVGRSVIIYKYPLISTFIRTITNPPKMPKTSLPNNLLIKIDTARREHKSGRSILEPLTKDKELSEVLSINLNRSYKQRYNNHLAQLHYIGTCIKLYQEKGHTNTEVRRLLGITRKQFYSASAMSKAIKDQDVIFFLEDVNPSDFDKLSNRDLLYIRNGAWPEDPIDDNEIILAKKDRIAQAVKDLFSPESSIKKAEKPHEH